MLNKCVDSYDILVRSLHVAPIKADVSRISTNTNFILFLLNLYMNFFRKFSFEQMEYDIKCYFERFGVVNSVKIPPMDDNANLSNFALVEFKLAKTAVEILESNQPNRIGNCDVQLKAAISVFPTECTNLCLTKCSHEVAKHSLRSVGLVARSIDINRKTTQFLANDYEIEILTMIAQHCTSSLKLLTINDFVFGKKLPNGIKFDLAFGNLEKLSFLGCCIRKNLHGILSSCAAELRTLRFERCTVQYELPIWSKFEKLEELQLIEFVGIRDEFVNGADGIIALNGTLKKLCIHKSSYFDVVKTLARIVQSVPNLVELDIDMVVSKNNAKFTESICGLGQLTSLTVLKLNLNCATITPLIVALTENFVPIEHMELSRGGIDGDTIEKLSKMEQLKVLQFHHIAGLMDKHMVDLAKGLDVQLEKLQLTGSTAENLTIIGMKDMCSSATKLSHLTLESFTIEINTADYKVILNAVQKRPQKIWLLIELIGDEHQVNVDKTILKDTDVILQINENTNIFDDSDATESLDSDATE